MSSVLANQVLAALYEISGQTRLNELKLLRSGEPGLLVEAFAADEQLQGMGTRDVIVLSTRANLSRSSLIGQEACLRISLADGTRAGFGGYISPK